MNIRFILRGILFVNLISSVVASANTQENMLQAIRNNSSEEVVRVLLAAVQQVKAGKLPECILLNAIMTGRTDRIIQAVDPLLNQGKNGMSPITWAVLLQKPGAVEALLDCGATVVSSLVRYAANLGDCQTVLLFMKTSIDLSSVMDDCMKMAMECQDSPIAQELMQQAIRRGYDVNNLWYVGPNNENIVFWPNANTIKFLIQHHANPNHVFQQYPGETSTPLIAAVLYQNEQAIRALLACGADVNKIASPLSVHNNMNLRGEHTPLYYAVSFRHKEIVELLLDNDARLD